MIFGFLFRILRSILRQRGVAVPDIGMQRQMPVMQATGRLSDALAARASDAWDQRAARRAERPRD